LVGTVTVASGDGSIGTTAELELDPPALVAVAVSVTDPSGPARNVIESPLAVVGGNTFDIDQVWLIPLRAGTDASPNARPQMLAGAEMTEGVGAPQLLATEAVLVAVALQAFVADTVSMTAPLPLGWNVTVSPVAAEVKVPPVICQVCVIPLRSSTDAVALPSTHEGAVIVNGSGVPLVATVA
jgi:hypothetical protein